MRDHLLGCFRDKKDRVLNEKEVDLDPNGTDQCRQFCHGFRYYGTEVNHTYT